MKKLFITIFSVIICTHALADTRAFTCITTKHIIFIDKIDSKNYRYRSWNKPKTSGEKPDMELKSKDVKYEGRGVCRYTIFSFKTGKVEFLVDDGVSCVETVPPENAIGNLTVLINEEVKSSYFCFK